MTAIETYFIGPTNTRGARYKAHALGTDHHITVDQDHTLDSEANHRKVAEALIRQQGWYPHEGAKYGDWFMGDNGPRGYVFVCALEYAKLEVRDQAVSEADAR